MVDQDKKIEKHPLGYICNECGKLVDKVSHCGTCKVCTDFTTEDLIDDELDCPYLDG